MTVLWYLILYSCTTAWLTLRLAGDYGKRVETKHRAQAQKPAAVSHGQSAFSRPGRRTIPLPGTGRPQRHRFLLSTSPQGRPRRLISSS